MEEIFSLPPLGAFDNNYQMVLEFMDTLGNPKFKIAGDVDLEGNSDIESLGNLVEVEGYLDLRGTNITALPDNLKVGDFLSLEKSDIIILPDNLHVGGSLHLYGTKIESLPDNLHVGRSLFLRNSKIASLANNLHVGYSLYLSNTPISDNYTIWEIRKMIEDKGGFVEMDIYI